MSEELKRGIPKGRAIGEKKFSKEETEEIDRSFEKILKECGVLKQGESIKDLNHPDHCKKH